LVSLKFAQDDLGYQVCDQVRSRVQEQIDQDVEKWLDSPELRTAIGSAAKKGKKDGKEPGWFKDTTRGDQWFKVVSPAFNDAAFLKKDLAVKLEVLWTWAEHV
jgi:hypothetical protein